MKDWELGSGEMEKWPAGCGVSRGSQGKPAHEASWMGGRRGSQGKLAHKASWIGRLWVQVRGAALM